MPKGQDQEHADAGCHMVDGADLTRLETMEWAMMDREDIDQENGEMEII